MKKWSETQKLVHSLTEKEIRNQIQSYLRCAGWFVYYNLAGLGSYPGLSDLVAIRDGQIIHIEIKNKHGLQSDKQRAFQKNLEAAGGIYILARDLRDVIHLGKEGKTGQIRMF